MRILILFSSRFGQTRKIAERLAAQLTVSGARCTLINFADLDNRAVSLSDFDKVLIGASIRYGHFAPVVKRWTDDHADALNRLPTAFFSVSILATKPHKSTPQTHSYTRKFLQKSSWRPQLVGVFAGELVYAKYNLADRYMMKLVMALNGGETRLNAQVEFTNWTQVQAFGERFIALSSHAPSNPC